MQKALIPYNEIRKHYDYLTPLIFERSERNRSAWVSPYCQEVDWIKIFTPIEYDAWHAIRSNGRVPLYPQYPVLNYFLDFGNPFLKIGIECDGAEFHLDKKKDNDRDYQLHEQGWKIFRISGSHCWKVPSTEYYDLMYMPTEVRDKILNEFYNSTVDGLIRALAICYCGESYYSDYYINEYNAAKSCLGERESKPVKDWININKAI